MLTLTADYHTHTRFSHGKGDIEDNVLAARALGLKIVGITDHGYGHMGYGIRRRDLPLMRERVNLLRDRYPDMEILLGVEANVLDAEGRLDVAEEDLKHLDLLLAGYHFGSVPATVSAVKLHCANFASRTGLCMDRARELNTLAFCRAMDRYPVNILTHPGAKGPVDIGEVAATASRRGVWLEINAHHGYLTGPQLIEAARYDVKFVVSSDAHRPEDVGNCSAGLERALSAGIQPERLVNYRME